MGKPAQLLARWALFSATHPKIILFAVLGLTLLAGWGIGDLELSTELKAMLPPKESKLNKAEAYLPSLGQDRFHLGLVKPHQEMALSGYFSYFYEFKRDLGASAPGDTKADAPFSPKLFKQAAAYLGDHGLYLLSEGDFQSLKQLLVEDPLVAPTPKHEGNKKIDPLGLADFFQGRLFPFPNLRWNILGQYLETKDGLWALLILPSQGSAGHTLQTEAFLGKARQVEQALAKKRQGRRYINPVTKQHSTFQAPKIFWTGVPTIILETKQLLSRTLWLNLVTSVLGVGLLFLIFFGSPRYLLWALLPLGIGVFWTFGLAGWTLGHLNIMTLGIGGILVGLAIDFPTYLLNRYQALRNEGRTPLESLQASFSEAGPSVVAGGVTMAMAFLILGLADFPAFRELGFLGAAGTLLALVAVLAMLPCLLLFLDRRPQASGTSRFLHYPHRWAAFPTERPLATLLGVGLLLLASILPLKNLRWTEAHEEIGLGLLDIDIPAVQNMKQVSQAAGAYPMPVSLIMEGNDWQALLEKNDRLEELLQSLKGQGLVAGVDSLSHWLPSRARQEKIDRLLKKDSAPLAQTFSENFNKVLARQGKGKEEKKYLEKYADRIAHALQQQNPATQEGLVAAGLQELLDHYRLRGKRGDALVTYAFVPPGPDPLRTQEELLRRLKEDPLWKEAGIFHPSEVEILQRVKNQMRMAFQESGLILLALLLLILWIFFRSLTLGLLSMASVILGVLAALGTLALLSIPFSMINLLWLLTYLGLAMDDTLQLGYLRRRGQGMAQALEKSGRAIIFTSLAAAAGFGSLIWIEIPLIRQAGLVITLAMAWELVLSLFFFPAAAQIFYRKN